MKKTILKKIWWSIVVVYLMVIYATAGVAPQLWDRINKMTGGNGTRLIYLACFIVIAAVLVHMVFVNRERSVSRYFLLLFFIWIFFTLNKIAIFPVEKIHLLEYGVLSVLFYNALKIDIDREHMKLYDTGIFLGLAAGFIDEIAQWFVPGRFFDFRDILLNFASSVTVFMAIRFVILKHPSTSRKLRSRGMRPNK